MPPSLMIVAATIFGVSFGWEPHSGGGVTYLIQLEPAALDTLKSGFDDISSTVPREVSDIRAFRIYIGQGEPPRRSPPAVEQVLQRSPGDVYTASAALPPPNDVAASGRGDGQSPSLAEPRPLQPAATGSVDQTSPAMDRGTSTAGATRTALQPLPTTSTALAGAPSPVATVNTPATVETSPNTRPWFVLVATFLLLFASLGANLFLGWTTYDAHRRCRDLVAEKVGAA